jgi:hypothetical protein
VSDKPGREYYMDKDVVGRLEAVIGELRELLEGWDHLEEEIRRERVGAVTELLANVATPAKNWRFLAEQNGIKLPEENDA